MQVLGLGLVWDELTVGQQFRTIGRTILDSDITAFCNATGMTEVLFTNAEYITKFTNFEGRLVPGSLVFCMAEGLEPGVVRSISRAQARCASSRCGCA